MFAVVDIVVSGRQETGALVAGGLALSGAYAKTAVRPVRLSKLQELAGPVIGDVLAILKDIRLTFPRWPQEAFPACSVESGDDSAPASCGFVAGNLVDLQMFDGLGDVVCGDVERGGVSGVVVEGVLAGSYGGTSNVSCGLVQGLRRATETRQWASAPGMSLGRFE